MASSNDNSWSWLRASHRAILGAIGIWILLVFFFTLQRDGRESEYDVVLRRHLSSFEHLNLIGRSSVRSSSGTSVVEIDDASAQLQRVQSSRAQGVIEENITCDFSHFRTDICHLQGDVRVNGKAGSVGLYSDSFNSNSPQHSGVVARVKPYTRKWEESCMKTIGEVTVKRLTRGSGRERRSCDVKHSVPAVVFSTGGYTGNVYHEFNDGLIPLFITASKFQGEVVFVILELHNWWMLKYGSVISRMSRYPPVDFDRTSKVHCFPELILGLEIHDELSINPGPSTTTSPSMHGFQQLLKDSWSSSTPLETVTPPRGRRPRLVLLARKGSRALLNKNAVIRLAKQIGFEVVTLAPNSRTELWKVHDLLHSAEVLVGVHGAALTHLLFMRPGSVLIQIVPLGTDWAAKTYYGEPAVKAGLEYIEYKILAEESSLVETLGRNHTAVAHPEEITSRGWWEMKKVYLERQNVKISLHRFKPVLQSAFRQVTGRQRQEKGRVSAAE